MYLQCNLYIKYIYESASVLKKTGIDVIKVIKTHGGLTLIFNFLLTHLSLASLLWDIGKHNSPRCDAAERGIPSGAILFAKRNFIKN